MNKIRQWWIGGAAALGLAVLIGAGAVMAQTPSSTPTTPTAVPGTANPEATPGGTFKSNEDTTHEQGETAQREADEDAGKRGGGGGTHKPNEDPAHEANEPADREAQEGAGPAPSATPSGTN